MQNQKELNPVGKEPFLTLVAEANQLFIEEIPSKTGSRHFFVAVQRQSDSSPTNAPKKSDRSPEDLLENATILMNNREYLLARHLFSAVLKKNLKDPEALRGLGTCLLRLGDPLAARKCFRALWDLFGEPKATFWLAQCFSSEKDDLLALEWYRKLKLPELLNAADRFEYFKELGNCLFRLGELIEAEAAYRKALEIQPTSDAIAANLGMLELQRNRLDSAVSYFERALRNQADNAKAHAGLGVVAYQSQDYALAAKFFGKALDIESQNLVALHQLMECAEHIEVESEVRKRIERFLEKEPLNHRIRFSLAALLFKKRLWRECEKELDSILDHEPQHINARRLKEEVHSHRTGK